MDIVVLVRSRVDMSVSQSWSFIGENGLSEGDWVFGEIRLLRDRLDFAVENEEIWFIRQYWDNDSNEWLTEGRTESFTNENGQARFEWEFDGRTCEGEPCSGHWRIIAHHPGSLFYPSDDYSNITLEIKYKPAEKSDNDVAEFSDDGSSAIPLYLFIRSNSILITVSIIVILSVIIGVVVIMMRRRGEKEFNKPQLNQTPIKAIPTHAGLAPISEYGTRQQTMQQIQPNQLMQPGTVPNYAPVVNTLNSPAQETTVADFTRLPPGGDYDYSTGQTVYIQADGVRWQMMSDGSFNRL